MDELEFYDGLWDGPQIDAGITLTNTLADALAVVIDGNKTPLGAATGQYVLVRGSTISGVSDGLYVAAKAIPAATAIDATYLTAASSGGLNALLGIINGLFVPTETSTDLNDVGPGAWWCAGSVGNTPTQTTYIVFCLRYSSGGSNQGVQIAFRRSGDATYIRRLNNGTWAAWKQISYTA